MTDPSARRPLRAAAADRPGSRALTAIEDRRAAVLLGLGSSCAGCRCRRPPARWPCGTGTCRSSDGRRTPPSGRRPTRTGRSGPAPTPRRATDRRRGAAGREPEGGEGLRTGDAVDREAVRALEAADGAAGLRAVDAVGGDAERLLEGLRRSSRRCARTPHRRCGRPPPRRRPRGSGTRARRRRRCGGCARGVAGARPRSGVSASGAATPATERGTRDQCSAQRETP